MKRFLLVSVTLLFCLSLSACADTYYVGERLTAVYRVDIARNPGWAYVDNYSINDDWFIGSTPRGDIVLRSKDIYGIAPNPLRKVQ